MNAVRARVAERPKEYWWSSYSGYIGRGREYGWVESTVVYGYE